MGHAPHGQQREKVPRGVTLTLLHEAGGLLGGAFGPMPPHESEYSVALHWSRQVHGPPLTDSPPLFAHCACVGSSAGHPKPSPFGSTHKTYARVAVHPLAAASWLGPHVCEAAALPVACGPASPTFLKLIGLAAGCPKRKGVFAAMPVPPLWTAPCQSSRCEWPQRRRRECLVLDSPRLSAVW